MDILGKQQQTPEKEETYKAALFESGYGKDWKPLIAKMRGSATDVSDTGVPQLEEDKHTVHSGLLDCLGCGPLYQLQYVQLPFRKPSDDQLESNLLDVSGLNNESVNGNSTTTNPSFKATSPPTIPTSMHASTSCSLLTTRTTAETSTSGDPLDTLVSSVGSLLCTTSPGAGSVGQVSTALILGDSILQSTSSGLFATLTLGDSTTTIVPTPTDFIATIL
ncbi:hypothetical protein HAV15_011166 [Penicillium sp. str. |nr:hypothetical protein HAV15_011166 [Penicillium sp. str. \